MNKVDMVIVTSMFDIGQDLIVYEDNIEKLRKKIPMKDLVESIRKSANYYNVDKITIIGNVNYLSKIKEKISLTNFDNNKTEIEIIEYGELNK